MVVAGGVALLPATPRRVPHNLGPIKNQATRRLVRCVRMRDKCVTPPRYLSLPQVLRSVYPYSR